MFLAILHTLFSRFLLLLIMIACFIPAVIFLVLPARWRYDNPVYYWFAHYFFYAAVSKAALVPINVIGRENIPNEPAIITANHQSSLDIPLVGMLLNRFPHVWLATNELLSSPIWRFVLPRVAVLVDMSSPMKAMRTLLEALEVINGKRRHMVVFPEGGRFDDGNVHDFYAGFVILAKKTGRPIVPIRIFGANKLYPKGTFWVRWHPVTLVVGKPMFMQENENEEDFKNRVYQWFVEQKEA